MTQEQVDDLVAITLKELGQPYSLIDPARICIAANSLGNLSNLSAAGFINLVKREYEKLLR